MFHHATQGKGMPITLSAVIGISGGSAGSTGSNYCSFKLSVVNEAGEIASVLGGA